MTPYLEISELGSCKAKTAHFPSHNLDLCLQIIGNKMVLMMSSESGFLKPALPVDTPCTYANKLLNMSLNTGICFSLSTAIDRMMTTTITLYREDIKMYIHLNRPHVNHHGSL